jgi:hypothetical protein
MLRQAQHEAICFLPAPHSLVLSLSKDEAAEARRRQSLN